MGRRPKKRRDAYGAWLQHLRKAKKLTQHELSSIVGVPQTTLAYWELSGNLPGRRVIIALCQALNVSAKELLRLDKQS